MIATVVIIHNTMIYIKTLTVSSYDFESATLSWEYTDPAVNTAGFHLDIYRSETPAPIAMFSGVASNISPDAYSYTDTSISGINLQQFHTWYYRIKTVETANPDNFEWSNPGFIQITPDLQTKIMLRQKGVGIKRYGTPVKLLKRRSAQGAQCTCYDPVLGRSLDDECELCHGTGIQTTGGYYDPIEIQVAINTRPKQNQVTPFGIWQQNDVLMDMLNYPIVEPNDLIIDRENNRYKVRQVAPFKKAAALVSQRIVATLQEKSSQVYEVSVE